MNTTVNTSKEHELYMHLINTKSTLVPIPRHLRMKKRWAIAVNRDNNLSQKNRNLSVEVSYKSILTKAKKLLAQSRHPVFERDYRKDNTESALAMHAYLNNCFYFSLECDFVYNYQLEFAFNNCPFEAEIRELLRDLPFGVTAKEVTLKPDFSMFYLNVLKVQNKEHITY